MANWGGSDEDNALYRNETHGRSWLEIRLVGAQSNRMGVGARVRARVHIDGHDRWLNRWMLPATGYASQNDPIIHFGLGDATEVEALEILWPSGVINRLSPPPLNRMVEVVEGKRTLDHLSRTRHHRMGATCAEHINSDDFTDQLSVDTGNLDR